MLRFIFFVPAFIGFAVNVVAESPADSQLKNAIESLLKSHDGEVALAVRSLHSDVHYEYRGDEPMPTASLIKLPMLVTAYRMVDNGQLDLMKQIELKEGEKVPGSGVLTEHFSGGIQLPTLDYLRLMIRYSDNTATNVVADQIGLASTATTMSELGLSNTKLHSKVYRGSTSIFPERSKTFGIGSTTANEMVALLSQLQSGALVSEESTKAILQHLRSCEDGTKLGARIPAGVEFAHKTGAVANCRTDAGIFYTSSGPVAVCFLTNKNKDQSWTDQNKANLLAAKVGELIVERFGTPQADARLREGAFGTLVEALQRTLNDRLSPTSGLSIDGDYGPATRRAVERFQRVHGLDENGIVTEETWEALGTLIEKDDPVPSPSVINSAVLQQEPQPDLTAPPMVTCKAWAIADRSGVVQYEAKSNVALEAASTTKIMTAFLVIRYAQRYPDILDESIEFSARADATVGSTSAIRAGELVSVRDLLYGLMLPSGNDASVALAESLGDRIAKDSNCSEEATTPYGRFVVAMNVAAKQLGMSAANYTNTHGLSDEKHVISARDLIRLTHAARQYDLFRKINRTRQYGCVVRSNKGYTRNVLWKNTNRLLKIEGYEGVKTGTTSAAGACLVAAGTRDGDELLAVVLGSAASDSRYADMRNLLRWAWAKRTDENASN